MAARLALKVLSCAVVLTMSQSASAQTRTQPQAQPQGQPQTEIDAPPQRRGGFMFSVVGGGSLGAAQGNPTAQEKRYDSAYRVSTGAAGGFRITPTIGGALTDWFAFGLGGSYADLYSGSERSRTGMFLFKLEAWPLFYRGGVFRDLGASVEFGAGFASIVRASDQKQLAASSVASTIGLGVFWEALRMPHLTVGPSLGYQRNWSDWFHRDDVTLGLRGTFYSGP
jgi:hypothetical protein